jgi:hypothetical protein
MHACNSNGGQLGQDCIKRKGRRDMQHIYNWTLTAHPRTCYVGMDVAYMHASLPPQVETAITEAECALTVMYMVEDPSMIIALAPQNDALV